MSSLMKSGPKPDRQLRVYNPKVPDFPLACISRLLQDPDASLLALLNQLLLPGAVFSVKGERTISLSMIYGATRSRTLNSVVELGTHVFQEKNFIQPRIPKRCKRL